jgi:lipoyl(octanoyl) transferase
MDIPRCRLLPFTTAEGPWQMAADEVLLEAAAAGRAALRFYAWSQPTLSLGYFQADALRRSDPRLAGLPSVRRASGGAALVHDREVTYALALPAGAPWQRRGESWLWRMHRIIAAALATLGVEARACDPGGERKLGEVLCFLHHTPGDLLIGPAKVAGSAQRKLRGALLQHGSILLARSPATPALPGIAELAGRRLSAQEVQAAVTAQFARDTGWSLEAGDWTEDERRRIAELIAAKYTHPGWNQKR